MIRPRDAQNRKESRSAETKRTLISGLGFLAVELRTAGSFTDREIITRFPCDVEGIERRHAGTVNDHQRERPMPPQGMFAAFKRTSYEAAWKTWEKAVDGLRRRAAQLGRRVDQLWDYLPPVPQYTPHHPGDRLAAARVERKQPDLARAHAEVMRQQRLEQIVQARSGGEGGVRRAHRAVREGGTGAG